MTREAKVMLAILVVVVGGLIGLFMVTNKPTPEPVGDKTKVIRENSNKTGSGTVQLVEFGDYQCPACSKSYPDVKQILKDFDGKVTFYFRHFPLTQHPLALVASQAAEAAGEQGKYWEMHDKLYENQLQWGDLAKTTSESEAIDLWSGYAKDIGLDVDKFKSAVSDTRFDEKIRQDMADGTALNVTGTPSFYVNGVQVSAGFSYADLRDAINAALNK